VRTNWIVFEHAQRLMRSRPLHRAVVARHGHRDEAHHDGTRLRCCVVVSVGASEPLAAVYWAFATACASLVHVWQYRGASYTFLRHGDRLVVSVRS